MSLSPPAPPTLIVHDRAQALAAFAAARALRRVVRIETPAEIARALGPAWMRAFLDACAAERVTPPGPVAFHCGDAPGLALAALKLKLPALRFEPAADAPPRVTEALAAVAREQEADLALGPPTGAVWRFPPPGGAPEPTVLELGARRWLSALPSAAELH